MSFFTDSIYENILLHSIKMTCNSYSIFNLVSYEAQYSDKVFGTWLNKFAGFTHIVYKPEKNPSYDTYTCIHPKKWKELVYKCVMCRSTTKMFAVVPMHAVPELGQIYTIPEMHFRGHYRVVLVYMYGL